MDVNKDWHSLRAAEVEEIWDVCTAKGLSSAEVEKRLERYGLNKVQPRQQQHVFLRFLLQFHQPLVYILLIAAAVTVLLGEYLDGSVIFAVVFINAIIGYMQESKALKAIDALSKGMAVRAQVIRDGKRCLLEAQELVPGDIVLVQSGDKFPADVRLTQVRDLKVDESALTGESVPVEKHTEAVPKDAFLGDRLCLGFSATVVTYGQGMGIVVATGERTEVGRILPLMAGAEEPQTPLTLIIKKFSGFLLRVILLLSSLVFMLGLLRGERAGEVFMVAVALAVGAIPEGLPVAVTIMLALGVAKMARRRAIIRKLVAVETLGSTNVICSDKTGTLTENQMTVEEIFAGNSRYKVSGIGYRPEGEIQSEERVREEGPNTALELCLKAGFLCNDSTLQQAGGRWGVEGDPTEGALLVAALKEGFTEDQL